MASANLTREECFERCCSDPDCNVAFMYLKKKKEELTCYKVKCNKDEDCLPVKQKSNGKLTFMGLVRPVNRSVEWAAVPGFDLRPFEGEY